MLASQGARLELGMQLMGAKFLPPSVALALLPGQSWAMYAAAHPHGVDFASDGLGRPCASTSQCRSSSRDESLLHTTFP